MTRHYDPHQPRVPAGHHEGGRWTGGGSASESILKSPLLDQDRLIEAALGIRGRDKQAGTVQLALQGAPVSVQSSFALPRTSPFDPRQAIKTSGLTGLLALGFLLFSASSLNNGEDGQQGTIRPDCEERPDRRTVCLYDLKTGRKELDYQRILDFVRSVFHADPCLERAIVTEVRPHDSAVQLPSNK